MSWRKSRQCAFRECTPVHTLLPVHRVHRVCTFGKRNKINGLAIGVHRCASLCIPTGSQCTHPLSPLGEGCWAHVHFLERSKTWTFWSAQKPQLFGAFKNMGKRRISQIERLAKLTELATRGAAQAAADKAERRSAVSRANQIKLTAWHAKRQLQRQHAKRQANRAGRFAADPARIDRRRFAVPGWQVLAARMTPGRWYSQGELVALASEFARGSVKAWLFQKLLSGGFAERAPNADFDAAKARGRQLEPATLWRLTEQGTREAAVWAEALSEVSG